TKPPFAAYLFAPVVWVLVRERQRRAVANAAVAALVATAVSLAWYGPRLLGLPRQIALRAVTHGAEEGKPPTLSAAGLAFYPASCRSPASRGRCRLRSRCRGSASSGCSPARPSAPTGASATSCARSSRIAPADRPR